MLQIPPDYTFVVQIVLFLALWMALKSLWFDPAQKVIAERAKRSEGALAEARALQDDAERLRREHAAALEQTRHEAQGEVQKILRAAETEQKRLIAEASAEAQRAIDDVRVRIAEDVATTRRALQGEIQDIAREIAQAVMGRAVT